MQNYKRKITYFYEYHNGKVGTTTGFLKLEIRGDKVKITVNIQEQPGLPYRGADLYFYHEAGDHLAALKVDQIESLGGVLTYQTRTDWQQLFQTGRDLYTFDGVAVVYNDSHYYIGDFEDRNRQDYTLVLKDVSKRTEASPASDSGQDSERTSRIRSGTMPSQRVPQTGRDEERMPDRNEEQSPDEVQERKQKPVREEASETAALQTAETEQSAAEMGQQEAETTVRQRERIRQWESDHIKKTNLTGKPEETQTSAPTEKPKETRDSVQMEKPNKTQAAYEMKKPEEAQTTQEAGRAEKATRKERQDSILEVTPWPEKAGSDAVETQVSQGRQETNAGKAGGYSAGAGGRAEQSQMEQINRAVEEQSSCEPPVQKNNEKCSTCPYYKKGAEQREYADAFEKMLGEYPKLPMYGATEFFDCVRIHPRDIGRLDMRNWKLGVNSFLTHGFYTYQYLLLGKMRFDNGSEHAILGVPGIFSNREKYLANMFGFEQFIPVKKTGVKTGEFGYWIVEISPYL